MNMQLHKTKIINNNISITLLLTTYSNPLKIPIDTITTITKNHPLNETETDLHIKTNILTTFAEKAKGLLVDVSADVYEGQILLTGSVKKPEDRTTAEAITQKIDGVRQIFNEIQVTEEGGLKASAKDLAIETKLKANLLTAKGVTSINYRWRAVNGVVFF